MTQTKEAVESCDLSLNKPWWSRRLMLGKTLCILLIIGILLNIGFFLFTIVKTQIPKTCMSPGCILAASQVITYVDLSADPCDDFFQFACGKVVRNMHGDLKKTSRYELETQISRRIKEIIDEPVQNEDHPVIRAEKAMLQACLNETAVETDSLPVLQEMLDELNGWPVVAGYRWKMSLFDWKEATYKLRRKGHRYNMMLNFGIRQDDSGRVILEIGEPNVRVIEEEHKKFYKKYMRDVAVAFGALASNAEIEMDRVFEFMEKLRNVSEKNNNHTASLLSRTMKVEDYQKNHTDIDWLEFINGVLYPTTNITSSDFVTFPRSEFMDAFLALLIRTPKRIQANYIVWRLIEDLTSFLAQQLSEIEGNFTSLTKQQSLFGHDRYKICNIMLESTLPNLIYARRYLPRTEREEVQEMIKRIKSELKDLLKQSFWMDEQSKIHALDKLEDLQEIVGLPGNYYNEDAFEKFRDHMKVVASNGSFISMYLTSRRLENDKMFAEINKMANTTDDSIYYDRTVTINAWYSHIKNAIFLPAGIVQGVFYNSERPMYLNYGAIGSIIGHEFTHGFCQKSSKYNVRGKDGNVWTNQTEYKYKEATKCLIEEAESYRIDNVEYKMNGTFILEENIADFTGVKLAYQAYKKWAKQHGEEPKLPGVDYSTNQLFWISATAYQCFKLPDDKMKYIAERHGHNVYRVLSPLRNNQDFAADFKCAVGSKMNPAKKCQIF